MKKLKVLVLALLIGGLTAPLSTYAGGGGDKTEKADYSFTELKQQLERLVKPLALKAKSQTKMWVVFEIDRERKLQLLNFSPELAPYGDELKESINNKLVEAGTFYSDTPYTLWVSVKEL